MTLPTGFEFCMLAKEFDEHKHSINGWLVSEKFDGRRALWDGGITRGIPASNVPFANVEKDGRLKTPPTATGLWTRRRKVIHAPTWFLDILPPFPCDGELWVGRKQNQALSDIAAHITDINDDDWKKVKFMVFDSPTFHQMFPYNPGWLNWCQVHQDQRGVVVFQLPDPDPTVRLFETILPIIRKEITPFLNPNLELVQQERLPYHTSDAIKEMKRLLIKFTEEGAEGLIARHPGASWYPKRTDKMLKIKPYFDSEATVVGYVWGNKTDKGSKLLGKMGALKAKWVNPNGKEVYFDLSGFTDIERLLVFKDTWNDARIIGECNPGKDVDTTKIINQKFPLGTKITFTYRELTDAGKPKEASFWRKKPWE